MPIGSVVRQGLQKLKSEEAASAPRGVFAPVPYTNAQGQLTQLAQPQGYQPRFQVGSNIAPTDSMWSPINTLFQAGLGRKVDEPAKEQLARILRGGQADSGNSSGFSNSPTERTLREQYPESFPQAEFGFYDMAKVMLGVSVGVPPEALFLETIKGLNTRPSEDHVELADMLGISSERLAALTEEELRDLNVVPQTILEYQGQGSSDGYDFSPEAIAEAAAQSNAQMEENERQYGGFGQDEDDDDDDDDDDTGVDGDPDTGFSSPF